MSTGSWPLSSGKGRGVEVLEKFYYLSNMFSISGGTSEAVSGKLYLEEVQVVSWALGWQAGFVFEAARFVFEAAVFVFEVSLAKWCSFAN